MFLGLEYKIEYWEKALTSFELTKLIVKLRHEDKLSIGDILKTVGRSKYVIQ